MCRSANIRPDSSQDVRAAGKHSLVNGTQESAYYRVTPRRDYTQEQASSIIRAIEIPPEICTMTDRTQVRSLDWPALFPVILLLRAARIAFRPSVFLAAALGMWLSCCGWWLCGMLFLPQGHATDDVGQIARRDAVDLEFGLLAGALEGPDGELKAAVVAGTDAPPYIDLMRLGPIQQFALRFIAPVAAFFDAQRNFDQSCYLLCGLLLQLTVWALVGGAIVRQALLELANGEAADIFDAWQFALGKYFFHFSAPLFPLLGVVLLAIPLALVGLLMRFDLGLLIAGLLWILLVPLGIAAAWLLVGLALGWPLLWGGVSAEPDGDHFGATSRMYAYVYQRPLHYLGYVLVAIVLGVLAGWLMDRLSATTIDVLHWGASWGSGEVRMAEIERHERVSSPNVLVDQIRAAQGKPTVSIREAELRDKGTFFAGGVRLIRWVDRGILYVAAGFGAGFFWCSFAGIYLLMRKAVDDKELDEVYLHYDDLKPPSVAEMKPPAPPSAKSAPSVTPAATPTPAPVTEPLPPASEEPPAS